MTRVYLNPKTRVYLIHRWLANLIWPRDPSRLRFIVNGEPTGWIVLSDGSDITIDNSDWTYEITSPPHGRRGLVDDPRDVGP